MNNNQKSCYPHIHFAPRFGWMNDPNGLVFHDGIYELYYQSNPDGIAWDNMTWSHARSKDLTHWQEMGAVLYPDENGMMFSGCGLINERGLRDLPKDALLFPYTAAKEDGFSIRLAYSIDGGKTLQKLPGELTERIGVDNRDPKVFWHEESRAYIMVLWLNGNDFGIFRSGDLQRFDLVSRITLPFGYECPDFFPLPVTEEDGGKTEERRWVFWTGDGTYYVGDFDGWHFKPDDLTFRRRAFLSDLPYAAQTFSGTEDVIQISWLRTKSICRQTTGAAGLPRVLSLLRRGDAYLLQETLHPAILQNTTDAGSASGAGSALLIEEDKAVCFDFCASGTYTVEFVDRDGNILLEMAHQSGSREMMFTQGEVTEFQGFGEHGEFSLIWDRGILEMQADRSTHVAVIDFPNLRTKFLGGIRVVSGDVAVKAKTIV